MTRVNGKERSVPLQKIFYATLMIGYQAIIYEFV